MTGLESTRLCVPRDGALPFVAEGSPTEFDVRRGGHRAVPSSMKSRFRSTPLTTAQAAYVASGYPGVHHASQFCSSSASLSYQTQSSPGFSLIIALRSFKKKTESHHGKNCRHPESPSQAVGPWKAAPFFAHRSGRNDWAPTAHAALVAVPYPQLASASTPASAQKSRPV